MTATRRPSAARLPPALALALPLAAAVVAAALMRPAAARDGEDDLLARGAELYATGCASCHGPRGGGVVTEDDGRRGPSLARAGEAAAFYQLSTGRMPMASSEAQPTRKDPAYDEGEIAALVAYVGSLGEGPEIPDVEPGDGDLGAGGEIYRANCQACHGAAGVGGALSYGRAAPPLAPATPTELGAAVRVGPGQMPVFGPETLDGGDLDDLARYVDYLGDPRDPGGLPIGRTGPIPEGFVAWLVGVTALVALVAWIGTRSPVRGRRE